MDGFGGVFGYELIGDCEYKKKEEGENEMYVSSCNESDCWSVSEMCF